MEKMANPSDNYENGKILGFTEMLTNIHDKNAKIAGNREIFRRMEMTLPNYLGLTQDHTGHTFSFD